MERVNCNLCGFDNTVRVLDYNGYSMVRCERCGLVYVNPRPSKEEFLAQSGHHGKKDCSDESACSRVMEKSYRRVAKRLAKLFPKRGKLLDIGCGYGHFLEMAKGSGWYVTGIDSSPKVIQKVAKMGFPVYCSAIKDILYVQNSYGQKSFPKQSFDCITMFFVLEHLTDPMEALVKVYELLKEGGVFVALVPHVTPTFKLLGMFLKAFKSDLTVFDVPCQLYDFSPAVLRKMLNLAGFSSVEIMPGLPFATEKGLLKSLSQMSVFVSKILYKLSGGAIHLPMAGHTVYAWRLIPTVKPHGPVKFHIYENGE